MNLRTNTAEDNAADTIRPRLDACGADCRKVHQLTMVNGRDPQTGKVRERPFSLGDIGPLEKAIQQKPDCKLVVIDPIGSFIGGKTDAHRDNEVRDVLSPLAKLAEKYNIAVLLVCHIRKGSGSHADDLVLGSRHSQASSALPGTYHLTKTAKNGGCFFPEKIIWRARGLAWPSRLLGKEPEYNWNGSRSRWA
jgi:RecA-family ATPase